ncbi:thioredoxin-dependent thiol peroxidase [Microvenator marinus]|uniref:thioredoxin-dependent peroxiredoxin n=1 Tax=Microvenator marinus TaxID=2600177 RepID=A0A5B8XPL2_9DELT|nr:thioredoxin-dependent thiol peroxidase [Microvenator marinus]QED27425.1 thioredoxin-dependent thiol peroxidase [Microvenator marinus]
MAENPKLNVGDAVPTFSAESDDAGTVSSKDLKGKKYVLYFYPKDMTPGCTTQACDFNDNLGHFKELGYEVYGVSPDSVASHEQFRKKHDLGFTLLADPEHKLAESFGVWREKKNYGKTYIGLVRSTFFVGEDGKISAIYDNVRAKGHVAKLLREMA